MNCCKMTNFVAQYYNHATSANPSGSEKDSLLCNEVVDFTEISKTPEKPSHPPSSYPEIPPTVKAIRDVSQVNDHRVLQNLLRNEDKSMPPVDNFLTRVQHGNITPNMRKIVADWMLEVIQEQNSQPEVFTLAMNIMDRFLCQCKIVKTQLQLLGSVCLLLASKIREPCCIPGKTLIIYTDYSITSEELKEWELLVLHKLQWELTAVTSLDFLDHTLPRLNLPESLTISPVELRQRTETILALSTEEYEFSCVRPSLLASSAALIALKSFGQLNDAQFRDAWLSLQTSTHAPSRHLSECTQAMCQILPSFLRTSFEVDPCLEKIMFDEDKNCAQDLPDSTTPDSPKSSPEPDLLCNEVLDNLEDTAQEDNVMHVIVDQDESESRSSSPLSAVDIFTEYNTNILQAIFDHADASLNKSSSSSSILVS